MSGKAVRETFTSLGVIASMIFVGLEIRQNTMVARAAAYQEMGFGAADRWAESHAGCRKRFIGLVSVLAIRRIPHSFEVAWPPLTPS